MVKYGLFSPISKWRRFIYEISCISEISCGKPIACLYMAPLRKLRVIRTLTMLYYKINQLIILIFT